MSTATELITIEEASRVASVSLSTLGYWIVAGMLEASVTSEGRVVRLADVRRMAGQLDQAIDTSPAAAGRQTLLQEDRVIDTMPRGVASAHDDVFDEVQERLERLQQQLQRVDQTLTSQVGQVDRLEAARSRDSEALERVQTTLAQHAETLRRLEARQATPASSEARPAHGGTAAATSSAASEPALVLRFRSVSGETAPADTAAPVSSLRMRSVTSPRPAPSPQPASAGPFGLRLALPRLPFANRKPVSDNS
jgi:hypothetical protein